MATSSQPASQGQSSNYMSYEDTVDITQRTHFKDYKFIYNPEVSALINDIPDGTVYSTKTSGPKPPPQQKGPRLSPSELGKLPRVAKDLNLSNTRKAFAIDSFVMEFLNRKIQGVQSDYSNCLFENVRIQFGNKDYMHNEDGEMYSASHLRRQTVAYAAENYHDIHPLIKDYIAPQSVQEWCIDMLDPNTEADFAAMIVMREMTKIPMCLILPTEEQPTAKNRDIPACHITFPKDGDCGIPPKDIPISVIFNGFDHYVGTRPKKASFKEGLDDIIEGLNNCMAISSDLIGSTDNHAIKQLLNLFNATNKENIFTMAKLFDFSDTSIDVTPKPKERTRRGTSSFKPNQCPCGIIKESPEQLLAHIQRRHSQENWYCSVEGCKSERGCKSKKAQKLHFKTLHLKEFSHYCLYCNFGRHEEGLVLSHMAKVHQAPKEHKCSICSKEFPSVQHLKRHVAICGSDKIHICQYCEKRFMHQQNLQNHIQVAHEKTKEKYKCNLCGKEYSSKESYMGHYKGYCQPLNILSGQALVPFNQPVHLVTGEPMEAEEADVQSQSVSAPQDTDADAEMMDKSVESSSSSSSSSSAKSVPKGDNSKDTLESEKNSDTEDTQEEN